MATRVGRNFKRFHRENPHVYRKLVKMARRLKAKGHRRIGMGMLFEVLRWRHYLATVDPTGFKLNNDYRSRYARMIMKREPDLAGIFDLRALHARRV